MIPEDLQWAIGKIQVTRVEERIIPIRWEDLVPGGAPLVDGCRPWIDPFVSASGEHLLLSVHSFIVQTPQSVIVVDTCIGESTDFGLSGNHAFGDRLAAALPGGLDTVDIVVCTHLHFDHIGWNTVEVGGDWVARFPAARYLVNKTELAAERDEEETLAYSRSIAPLIAEDRLDAVQSHHWIDPWVSLEPSPGHTPGHVSLRITDGGAVGIITGDLAHTPLQLAHPDASSRSDADPTCAARTREQYIAELVGTDVLILGTHFAPPTAGQLSRENSGVRFR